MKFIACAILLFALFAVALSQSGIKDIYGNYMDYHTGQLNTVDGRVYNPAWGYHAVPVQNYVYGAPIVYAR
ncbi:uncharacterized protein LOC141848925 [Brevipalpus obovatus]|uniref:uncharacterized protein LOC141848925 n=1 Tax=Brevipalpus obovatus TaxID=246614 RepID=UPI003D9DC684